MTGLPPLREIIKAYGLSASKSFGQHFLLDSNITDKIVRLAALTPEDTVLEIGPGPGGLTRSLLASLARRVHAVEKDRRFIEALQPLQAVYADRFVLHEADALTLPLHTFGSTPRKMVANLPYNVGTLLLLQMLQQRQHYTSMVLMFQKEVAQRLVAPVGSKAYGRLSVLVQSLCRAELLFNLPAAAFVPPPKVASSVVRLVPDAAQGTADIAMLEKVTAAAFGQRRKMLRTSLKPLFNEPEVFLPQQGIDPQARAENLSPQDYQRLASALTTAGKHGTMPTS